MSGYPWDILGIEPTTDELAIRRAYARKLKQHRPDEDPEGFANLVRAREYALQWRAPHQRDLPVTEGDADEVPANDSEATAPAGQSEAETSQGFSSRDFGAPLTNEPEATAPPEQPETEASQGFSSRDFGAPIVLSETCRFDRQAQVAAFTATMKRLRELVLGTSEQAAAPVWQENWPPERLRLWELREWRTVLSALSEFTFEQRGALRDFVVSKALPQLHAPPVGAASLKRLIEDAGPSAVVDLWETEFGIRHDQAALAKLCGTQAMLRYLDWVALAERAPPLHKRTDAERHFIDCLDKLLPQPSPAAAAGSAPNEAWAPDRWTELFSLVRRMGPAEAARCRDLFAERLTATLPKLPSAPLAKLGAGAAPATIVGEIEREFSLSEILNSPFVEPEGASRYQEWLAYAHRMRAIAERCAKGPPAYRNEVGIPLLPPEDLALGALPDQNVGAALAQAQRDGRWRLTFNLPTFAAPAGLLARSGLLWSGVGLAAVEIAVLFGLQLPSVTPYQVTVVAAVFLFLHLALALALQRMTVMAAVQRVKRADRRGLANPAKRQRAIARRDPPGLITNLLFIAAIIFPMGLLGSLGDASTRAQRLRNPTGSTDKWILTGERHLRTRDFSAAISAFTRAIEKDVSAERAYRGRGDAFLAADNPHRAIDDYNHAVLLNSNDAAAHLQRALAYLSLNRGDLAAPDYAAMTELDPDRGKQRLLYIWPKAISIYLNRSQPHPADRNLTTEVIVVRSTRSPPSISIKKDSSVSGFDLETLSKLENSDLSKKSLRYQMDHKRIPEVTVFFSIDRNGHVLSKIIETSSGDSDLDAAASLILDRSDPLPPPPPPAVGAEKQWNFVMTVAFRASPGGR